MLLPLPNRAVIVAILVVSIGGTSALVYPQTPQSEDVIVAVVNGRRITQNEVDNSILWQLFPLSQQTYALRKAALDNLILRTILGDEAKKRGITVEQLRQQLTTGKVEVSPSQVDELYVENASVFASMSPDEAKERLRLDLESQARMQNYREAISKLKQTAQIEILLEEPKLTSVSEINAPSIGSKKAPITIIEFSDFQCPFCKNSQTAIKQVLQTYKNDVRLIFKHRPLENHPDAFSSAQAAFCAGEQGFFWQYHDALFASDSLSPEVFKQLASDLRLDVSKFGSCIKSEASRVAVLRDLDEARRLGINSTPTFVVNGRLFRGALSFEDFKAAIDRELKSFRTGPRTK